ncbi:hypothetical protein ACLOJK_005305 [Asimina triloba]
MNGLDWAINGRRWLIGGRHPWILRPLLASATDGKWKTQTSVISFDADKLPPLPDPQSQHPSPEPEPESHHLDQRPNPSIPANEREELGMRGCRAHAGKKSERRARSDNLTRPNAHLRSKPILTLTGGLKDNIVSQSNMSRAMPRKFLHTNSV